MRNLIGEPDYRQVRLHWETPSVPTNGFNVRYCELQTWGSQRCRNKTIKEPLDHNDVESEEDYHVFTTDVKGLRMATTYSFEVKVAKGEKGDKERKDRAEGDDRNQNIIVIPTKGCK